MARYATGVHAKAICDKCGLSYPYISLRAEWNGLRSCPDCWDAKHPALSPVSVSDNEALRSARPGTHKREDSRVIILSGVSTTIDLGSEELLRSDSVIPAATTGSVSSTISIGSESIEADMLSPVQSGIAVTTAIGTEGIRADAIIPQLHWVTKHPQQRYQKQESQLQFLSVRKQFVEQVGVTVAGILIIGGMINLL